MYSFSFRCRPLIEVQMHGVWNALLSTAVSAVVLLLVLPSFARRVGLLDYPTGRKRHERAVPLVGGLAIVLSVTLGSFLDPAALSTHWVLLIGLLVICTLGVADDLVDLQYRVKLIGQIAVSLLIVVVGGNAVTHVGYLFFSETGYGLGPFSAVFSVVAIVGLMNAYNMIDGHDGLAASCGVTTLVSMFVVLLLIDKDPPDSLIILLLIPLSIFLIFNLDSLVGRQRQVFLGDAGSLILGLAIAYLLIRHSGVSSSLIKVSAAPWLVGLPLLDMIAVMTRRILNCRSPFGADRIHFHHIMMDYGLGKGRVLLLALALQLVFSGIGIFGVLRNWPDGMLFWGLFVTLLAYLWLMKWLYSNGERSQARSAS